MPPERTTHIYPTKKKHPQNIKSFKTIYGTDFYTCDEFLLVIAVTRRKFLTFKLNTAVYMKKEIKVR